MDRSFPPPPSPGFFSGFAEKNLNRLASLYRTGTLLKIQAIVAVLGVILFSSLTPTSSPSVSPPPIPAAEPPTIAAAEPPTIAAGAPVVSVDEAGVDVVTLQSVGVACLCGYIGLLIVLFFSPFDKDALSRMLRGIHLKSTLFVLRVISIIAILRGFVVFLFYFEEAPLNSFAVGVFLCAHLHIVSMCKLYGVKDKLFLSDSVFSLAVMVALRLESVSSLANTVSYLSMFVLLLFKYSKTPFECVSAYESRHGRPLSYEVPLACLILTTKKKWKMSFFGWWPRNTNKT